MVAVKELAHESSVQVSRHVGRRLNGKLNLKDEIVIDQSARDGKEIQIMSGCGRSLRCR